jgi:hypothetical protein
VFKRFLLTAITEALQDTPVIVITGARQTGKSTLCRQLVNEGKFNGDMVTLDDPTILAAASADPLGFLQSLNHHLIIDEVQRAPELFLSIKKLVDEDRTGRRIILTGSADVMALPQVADSLAGRTELHNLWPLSQNEIRGTPSNFLRSLTAPEGKFPHATVDWNAITKELCIGGYPEALRRETESRRSKWFNAYITSVLQKDIRDLSKIEGLSQIPNILQLLATRVGSTVNLSDVARLSGVKNTTLQRYMTLLEHVFLIVKIPAWTPNAEGQYVKSPKIFLNDTGLLCHLRGENALSLQENRTLAGSFFKNFVVMDIIKQLSWSDAPLKPYHFSIHKGAEVDLILEDNRKKLYGIEIKSKASIKEEDFKGLKKFSEIAGHRFEKGILLYTGNQVVGGFGGSNLSAVPVAALWA